MSKIFIDTNILVYCLDQNDLKKQSESRKRLTDLQEKETGVISTQVLQEFYVTAIKKLRVEPLLVKKILHSFENFEIVSVDVHLINEAIDCSILQQISFWDALIVVTAEKAKCQVLWTEDLNHDQVIRGMLVKNIFL
ncbi:hypothetical protein MNBD_UNCLBAC01-2011 [hydrothermal vent metagenome]|uniref:PIN domain-containing protein n=1 Tax=hydrothermal vent metagenome TaxID=652676 RepID=A0A3B1DN11_9ZZZZ